MNLAYLIFRIKADQKRLYTHGFCRAVAFRTPDCFAMKVNVVKWAHFVCLKDYAKETRAKYLFALQN